ncbi:anti-sigma-F factor Fin family protein [Bacillus massilinigeriensis]|uniref:anti-sigma-F factor Fin family protein n=1 Tax=Bacillus mediterraneensis TaxID=1805474 RepID=UPI0008F86A3A|nr:anti-sigma-F factor Fin family protein [Bacillus mediterraneensis]
MAIHYHCRHCGVKIGSLENISYDSGSLGIDKLTDAERQEMVSYEGSGDIHIKSICEDCQEALDRNPDFHEHDYLIH